MSRQSFGPLFVLVILVVLVFSQLGRSEPATKSQEFMRGKLSHSQQILEAIALEDYSAIEKHAEQLRLLSLDANWQVIQTEEYMKHSSDFRGTAASLGKAGKARNLDGALLAYFQMTQNCVNCHRYVRQTD